MVKAMFITLIVVSVLWTAAVIWEQLSYDPEPPMDWDDDEFFEL